MTVVEPELIYMIKRYFLQIFINYVKFVIILPCILNAIWLINNRIKNIEVYAYHVIREYQYHSLELGALECKTLGNDSPDFIDNIHNRQREFKSRVSGTRNNYRLSYHFPINPNTSSNYAGLKYAEVSKQSIHLPF